MQKWILTALVRSPIGEGAYVGAWTKLSFIEAISNSGH